MTISVLTLAGLACGLTQSATSVTPDATGPEEASDVSQELEAIPTLEPNPLDVNVSLDESLAATALIPVEGGTLNATGADGTTFTLTIPPEALLGEVEITLTPVSGVDGLPLNGGMVAAAHLEPEGLRLFAPATLTIETGGELDAEEVSGFGYYLTGEDFHLEAVEIAGSTLTFEVMHFSGRGAGRGTAGDRSAQRSRVPRRPEAQAAQELSFRDANARAALDNWYANAVQPKINAAQGNVAMFDSALADFVSWLSQVHKSGLADGYNAQIRQGLEGLAAAVELALEGAARVCAEGENPQAAVETLRLLQVAQRISLLLELYNPDMAQFLSGDIEDMQDQLASCLSFTLSFSSTISDPAFIYDVQAEVPVRWEPGRGLTGEAPSVETVTWVGPAGCGVSLDASPGTFTVTGANIGFNVYDLYQDDRPPSPPGISIQFDPGTPVESGSMDCPGFGVVPIGFERPWRYYFGQVHGGGGAGGGFEVSLEPGSGEVFASTSLSGTGTMMDGSPVEGTTSIELIHTPR